MNNAPLIQVSAEPFYIESQSDDQAGRFVFAYTIHIQNNGNAAVQLLRRYWSITDGNGKTVEVRGDGVIGEQPLLAPGEHYTYTSGSVIETPVGTMHGHYEMQHADGSEFTATIPLFRLAVPGVLN
jgi:ApaG protein